MILRVRFCRWAMRMIQQDEDFFRYVLFSDESTFKNTGELNRHNCHYWSDENSSSLVQVHRQSTLLESYDLVWNRQWLFDWSLFL